MNLILSHRGNYKDLITFQKATVIYDLTYFFANTFLSRGDRTVDQMIQAARSGKQNIAEGVAASSTNAETEIKLVNVAKASLKELLTDYEDFLRTRGHRQWPRGSAELEWVRNAARTHSDSDYWMNIARMRTDNIIANIAIVLLKQEDYLLFKQLEALEAQFKSGGDLRGRLRAEDVEIQEKQAAKEKREAITFGYPKCPKCGKVMTKDEAKAHALKDLSQVYWRCETCQTEEKMHILDFLMMDRARRRRMMEVGLKWDQILRRR